jgi:hypothetical protein
VIYCCISVTVVQDDDLVEEPFEEPSDEPSGTRTPPTPVVSPSPAPAPPPPAPPLRQRAMAQLRPVSVPAVIKDMAGRNLAQTLRDFDRHYMPNGHPDPDSSATGFDAAHRAELKRKAEGIFRSLSEVFAFLTYGTASLEEAKRLLAIITNVCFQIYSCYCHYLYYLCYCHY